MTQTLVNYRETSRHITVDVPQISHKHLTEFVRLDCAPQILSLRLMPNAKEISESMGAYNALRKHVFKDGESYVFDPDDEEVLCACVGDGISPRTGGLIAFRTKWRVVSIDPELDTKKWSKKINRLECIGKKIEHVEAFRANKIVLVAVHSHADLPSSISKMRARDRLAVVAIPCCVAQNVVGEDGKHRKPDVAYDDWAIFSPQREVNVWTKLISKS